MKVRWAKYFSVLLVGLIIGMLVVGLTEPYRHNDNTIYIPVPYIPIPVIPIFPEGPGI